MNTPQVSNSAFRTEIEFSRSKKYTNARLLGSGACGETVLVHDDDMGIDLVVKKYSPIVSRGSNPTLFAELIDRFREEARLLFQLNHPNVVRVYNFYDYRKHDTSYIVMEYVAGVDLHAHLSQNPLDFDTIFEKTIGGFEHLEGKSILHRDIRPQNIMVRNDGEPKIIDFGFGKRVDFDLDDHSKSISLNWWCDKPPEFAQRIYDFQTEVYFVGKLFEHIMLQENLEDSKHATTIRKMCEPSRDIRFKSFREVLSSLNQKLQDTIHFSTDEMYTYRTFASKLEAVFSTLDKSASYERDASVIIDRLQELYTKTMLEEYLPDPAPLCRVFVNGGYRYYKRNTIEVEVLLNFLNLLKRLEGIKREVVIANVFTRLDAIPRKAPDPISDDEIPF